ncbi:MAG: hypothetical protein HYX51_08360 [Chloroflexi bacterium]|nr:hypothetical protein [Chloroflexota bacterium]
MPLPAKCPPPVLPPGSPTQAHFGTVVMQWGSGDHDAIERISSISVDHLRRFGVTLELAKEWLTFYQCEFNRNPFNPSVLGRVQLMWHIVNRLRWSET